MKKRIIVDGNTGEILDELEKGDRIVKGNSIEYLRNTVDMVEMNECKFIKLQDSFGMCVDELNLTELRVFYKLMRYVRYGTGEICYENGKEMYSSEMAKEFSINDRNLQKTLKNLCNKEIICRKKRGKGYIYYMNPYICLKGNRVTRELMYMFEKSKFNIKK